MNTALRLILIALYPLLVVNFVLWWPLSKVVACFALALMAFATLLMPDRYE